MKKIIILVLAIFTLSIDIEANAVSNKITNTTMQSSDWEYLGIITLYSYTYRDGSWVVDDTYEKELWVRIIAGQAFYKVREKGTQSKHREYAVAKNPNYGKPDKSGSKHTHYIEYNGFRFYFTL